MATEKRITWYRPQKRKWDAFNGDMEFLGSLEYDRCGAHMVWWWNQDSEMRMSPGCLQEVRDKQKELHNKIEKGETHDI